MFSLLFSSNNDDEIKGGVVAWSSVVGAESLCLSQFSGSVSDCVI